MKVIGVTGGIASGKSTVSQMLADFGLDHLDADLLVHELMAGDRPMIDAIAALYPRALEGGRIGRGVLSQIVTRDKSALAKLESIIHPFVRRAEERAIEEARRARKKGVVLDIPLLFETGADALCDIVVAVSAPPAVARRRAFSRAGMTEEKWERLTRRQLSDQERCRRADHVVSTDRSEEETRREVALLVKSWSL